MASQVVLENGQPAVQNGTSHAIPLGISTGGFFWRPSDVKVLEMAAGAPSARFATSAIAPTVIPSTRISAPQINGIQEPRLPQIPKEPPLLTKEDGNVLALLQKRTFCGKGFNSIFRPRSDVPLQPVVPGSDDNVLQLNLTQETMTFSESLGAVPNRGFGAQPDITLKGISYVQRVDDLANPKTGQADAPPSGIHFEPGVWLAVPACTIAPPNQGPTLCRMASIPHGTTINAQGAQPAINNPLPGSKLVGDDLAKTIRTVPITPFRIGKPASKIPFNSQNFDNGDNDRLPPNLPKFDNPQIRMKELLVDPNAFLRNSLKDQAKQGQEVVEFYTVDITTLQTPVLGGGNANIAFLGGSGSSMMQGGSNQNAHAVQMTTTYWVETVRAKISIQGNNSKAQSFKPAGADGPTFVVGPTTGLGDCQIPVTWTQLQYSQNVLLNFNTLSWPHISVATLIENTTFDVKLQAMA